LYYFGIVAVIQETRSYRIRRIFNFRKAMKKVKVKKLIKNITQDGALIGHAGRRPIHIPDEAKHVFVCGTTGSGKTVALLIL
jgi:type IV secretory pathway VirB4 component